MTIFRSFLIFLFSIAISSLGAMEKQISVLQKQQRDIRALAGELAKERSMEDFLFLVNRALKNADNKYGAEGWFHAFIFAMTNLSEKDKQRLEKIECVARHIATRINGLSPESLEMLSAALRENSLQSLINADEKMVTNGKMPLVPTLFELKKNNKLAVINSIGRDHGRELAARFSARRESFEGEASPEARSRSLDIGREKPKTPSKLPKSILAGLAAKLGVGQSPKNQPEAKVEEARPASPPKVYEEVQAQPVSPQEDSNQASGQDSSTLAGPEQSQPSSEASQAWATEPDKQKQENARAQQRIASLEGETTALNATLVEKNREFEDLRIQLANALSSKNEVQVILERLRAVQATQERESNQRAAAYSEKEASLNRLNIQNAELQNRFSQLKSSHEAAAARLTELESQNGQLAHTLAEKESDRAALEKRYRKAKDKKKRAQETAKAAHGEIERLKKAQKDQEEKEVLNTKSLHDNLSRVRTQNRDLSAEIAAKNDLIRKLEAEKDALVRQNREGKEKLADVERLQQEIAAHEATAQRLTNDNELKARRIAELEPLKIELEKLAKGLEALRQRPEFAPMHSAYERLENSIIAALTRYSSEGLIPSSSNGKRDQLYKDLFAFGELARQLAESHVDQDEVVKKFELLKEKIMSLGA